MIKRNFNKHSIKSALCRRPVLSVRDDAKSLLKGMMPGFYDEIVDISPDTVSVKITYPVHDSMGYHIIDMPLLAKYNSHTGDLISIDVIEKELGYSMNDLYRDMFEGIEMTEEEFNETTPEEAIEIGKDELEAFLDYMYDTYDHIYKDKFVRLVKQYMEEEGIVQSSSKSHRRFKKF